MPAKCLHFYVFLLLLIYCLPFGVGGVYLLIHPWKPDHLVYFETASLTQNPLAKMKRKENRPWIESHPGREEQWLGSGWG